jgi:hypothetical protein
MPLPWRHIYYQLRYSIPYRRLHALIESMKVELDSNTYYVQIFERSLFYNNISVNSPGASILWD